MSDEIKQREPLRIPDPDHIQSEIQRVMMDARENNPQILKMIAPKSGDFLRIMDDARQHDERFTASGSELFQAGATPQETAQNFTNTHILNFRPQTVQGPDGSVTETEGNRPSLPAMAMAYAQELGADPNSPQYKALVLSAVRAEIAIANEPDYHSRQHFADVMAHSAVQMMIAKENGETPNLNVMTAAVVHDLGHPGGKNPPGDHYFLERQSFEAAKPYLEAAGLPANEIHDIDMIIKPTSPDGPNGVLDKIVMAQRNGQDAHAVFDQPLNPKEPDGPKVGDKYPELKELADRPDLALAAAKVSAADLYGSSGAGFVANHDLSIALTNEWKQADVINPNTGTHFDHGTDGARKGFIQFVVGKQYASPEAELMGGAVRDALVEESTRRMDVDKETLAQRKEIEESMQKMHEARIAAEAKAPESAAAPAAPAASKFAGPLMDGLQGPDSAAPVTARVDLAAETVRGAPPPKGLGADKIDAMIREEMDKGPDTVGRITNRPDDHVAPTVRTPDTGGGIAQSRLFSGLDGAKPQTPAAPAADKPKSIAPSPPSSKRNGPISASP